MKTKENDVQEIERTQTENTKKENYQRGRSTNEHIALRLSILERVFSSGTNDTKEEYQKALAKLNPPITISDATAFRDINKFRKTHLEYNHLDDYMLRYGKQIHSFSIVFFHRTYTFKKYSKIDRNARIEDFLRPRLLSKIKSRNIFKIYIKFNPKTKDTIVSALPKIIIEELNNTDSYLYITSYYNCVEIAYTYAYHQTISELIKKMIDLMPKDF